MVTISRQPTFSRATLLKPMVLKLVVGIATAALLAGWAAGVAAQSANPPALPAAPLAAQDNATPLSAPPAAQTPAGQPQQATAALPPLPLGHDDVREVQNQLTALGFDPGPADGQAGPATTAAAQHYDQSRGGSGQVAIDSALLARLKADSAPRLTYDQVAARSRSRAQAQAPAASGASQLGGIVQQLAPLIGAAINSGNSGGYPGYYGPGPGYYGPGPGYYGPGPVYGGYGYGY
jgi:hypothetical protein